MSSRTQRKRGKRKEPDPEFTMDLDVKGASKRGRPRRSVANKEPAMKTQITVADLDVIEQWKAVGKKRSLSEDVDIARFLLSQYFDKTTGGTCCSHCGTALKLTCPICPRENPPIAETVKRPQSKTAPLLPEAPGELLQDNGVASASYGQSALLQIKQEDAGSVPSSFASAVGDGQGTTECVGGEQFLNFNLDGLEKEEAIDDDDGDAGFPKDVESPLQDTRAGQEEDQATSQEPEAKQITTEFSPIDLESMPISKGKPAKPALKPRNQKAQSRKKNYKHLCKICGKTFEFDWLLLAHHRTHRQATQAPQLLCTDCGKMYKGKESLTLHRRKHHSDTVKYQCLECPKSFLFATDLEDHVNVHRDLRPHQCPDCKRQFASRHNLSRSRHVCIAPGTEVFEHEVFSCEWPGCHKVFLKQKYLKQHQNTHEVMGRFVCVRCGSRFIHRAQLSRHSKKCGLMEVEPDLKMRPRLNFNRERPLPVSTGVDSNVQLMTVTARGNTHIHPIVVTAKMDTSHQPLLESPGEDVDLQQLVASVNLDTSGQHLLASAQMDPGGSDVDANVQPTLVGTEVDADVQSLLVGRELGANMQSMLVSTDLDSSMQPILVKIVDTQGMESGVQLSLLQ